MYHGWFGHDNIVSLRQDFKREWSSAAGVPWYRQFYGDQYAARLYVFYRLAMLLENVDYKYRYVGNKSGWNKFSPKQKEKEIKKFRKVYAHYLAHPFEVKEAKLYSRKGFMWWWNGRPHLKNPTRHETRRYAPYFPKRILPGRVRSNMHDTIVNMNNIYRGARKTAQAYLCLLDDDLNGYLAIVGGSKCLISEGAEGSLFIREVIVMRSMRRNYRILEFLRFFLRV